MIRYTTPELTIELKGNVNVNDYNKIHVTFSQNDRSVDVTAPEIIDTHTLSVRLTQEQTGLFRWNMPVAVQVNLIAEGGAKRVASEIAEITYVEENLLRQVLE